MGRRGPLPAQLPENVTRLRGEVTHSSPKVATVKPRPGKPTRPSWLTPYGKLVWGRVVKELDPLGLLSPVDRETLAAYCDASSIAKLARDQIHKHGILLVGQKGDLVKNPAWQVFQQSAGILDRLGTKLALNPSSRLRILHDLGDLDVGDDSDLD